MPILPNIVYKCLFTFNGLYSIEICNGVSGEHPLTSLGRTAQQGNRASWSSQDSGDKGPAAVWGGEGSLGTQKTLPQKLRWGGLCYLPRQAGRLPRLAPTHLSGKNCSAGQPLFEFLSRLPSVMNNNATLEAK